MPRFPKPFFRQTGGAWYVEVGSKQINLGSKAPRRGFLRQTFVGASAAARAVRAATLSLLAGLSFVVFAAAAPRMPATEAVPEFHRVPPTPPEKAESTFRTTHGFRMELLAAEPLVSSPVVLEYDADGRAWVLEMRDYPYTDKSTDKPGVERTTDLPLGRVRVLEDTDGDGRFDKSTVFADNLSWPTGLVFWKRGVYVLATPDLWYLEDTDGDLKADVRKKVFSGFRKFNVQAVANNLKWGLDHRIYGAGSSNGGNIRRGDGSRDLVATLGHNDFWIDPRTNRFELTSGGARFGNTFDDWGNRFLCNIRNPVQHVVLNGAYLAHNPYLPVPAVVQDVAESGDQIAVFRASPPEPWRVFRADRWVAEGGHHYPRSELTGEGFFTSASGVTIYRGSAYPREFYGNAFVAEVAGNIVHRQLMQPVGVTFRSKRADPRAEFVASTDNWFRPVNFTNAPDGTLHLVDMYREVIEHPWSIPDDIKAHLDLESGRDRGRIYRMVPPGTWKAPPQPHLSRATTSELVQSLENPSSWWRETAHHLIFERQDKSAVSLLRLLVRDSRSPLARMHALWSLEGLNALDDADLLQGLSDSSGDVREHAVRLSESRLSRSPSLLKTVLALAVDAKPRVRFQVALSLADLHDERIVEALAAIATCDADDVWIRTACLSSALSVADRLLIRLMSDDKLEASPARLDVIRQLAATVAGRKMIREAEGLLQHAATLRLPQARRALATNIALGLDDGFRRAGTQLTSVIGRGDSPARRLLDDLVRESQAALSLPTVQDTELESAAELFALGKFPQVQAGYRSLLSPQRPRAVQFAAIRNVSKFAEPQAAALLVSEWKQSTPAVRGEIIEALLSRRDWTMILLRAVRKGEISPAALPPSRRDFLRKSADSETRELAAAVLEPTKQTPRAPVIAAYQAALSHPGDGKAGATIFQKQCAGCHQLRGIGQSVGPNLSTVLNRTPQELVVHIFDPNREVAPNFVEYVVVTSNGRTMSGIIADESATTITLRRKDAAQDVILRQNVEAITSTGKSLMPEGLEKTVSPRDIADLLTFLYQK